MSHSFVSRRRFFATAAGATALAPAARLLGQQPAAPAAIPPAIDLPVFNPNMPRSTVALIKGEERRKNIHDALMQLDAELRPELAKKSYVFIKPNLTSSSIQLASTHPDAIRGILDYLDGRFKGPVIIGEAASSNTTTAYDAFNYQRLISEYPKLKVDLVDLSEEGAQGKIALVSTIDHNLHLTAARVSPRNMDPNAFIICAAIPKTHESMIMTAAVKNMVMGSPLRSTPKESNQWSDKRKIHVPGYHQHNLNIHMVTQQLAPHWNLAVLDGYQGMEGQGPVRGTEVPHRIAIASRDFIAADRVAIGTMGIDPTWVGYLQYSAAVGLGNYDLKKIDIKGETIASVARKYQMNPNFDREIQWLGPIENPQAQPPAFNGAGRGPGRG
jgi:uncharacterized protein (DUF362 family)